ncbi:heparinase II/III family protein [Rhizobium sp. BK251]|uniref:heparinase II/III family protein n=1 Tax=Rhizobium sp. BK251 TaxID=2512125 RepID=UPI001053B060|nr:heparinase II/III family protein [Rhizobium sp. BK251]TCL73060.1 putative heparinase superfamily protein [Rhizobium sp. BK251]
MQIFGRRLSGLYVREAWRRIVRRVALLRLRLFRHTVRAPERLIVAPTDLRSIDPFVADEILADRFPLAGRLLETHGKSPFSLSLPSRTFASRLHGFGWLRHMRANKSEAAAAAARSVVNDWIAIHGRRVTGIAWEPDVAAQRLIAWLSHSPVLLQSGDRGFYRRFMRSLAFQVRYLRRIAPVAPDGEVLFRIRIALAVASVAMPARPSVIRRAGQDLDREIDRQILADGGHISRNPRVGLELLLDLLPLRQTYVNLGHDVPVRLIPGIDRMYPALRFFRHQDGDLALFNGATSTPAGELLSVLRYDETGGQPFKAMPQTRYQRLASGKSVVIADTGPPAPGGLSATAHAGCLSFEMSSGRHRLIVNSGSPKFAGRRYAQMARATAAHSTVTLDDTSSSRITQSAFLGHVMTETVHSVTVERGETEDGRDSVKASHDGYLRSFGIVHERELTLNATGTILTGRDRLVAEGEPRPKKGVQATARFHVHPAINLQQTERESVLLTTPDGETWLFSSPGNDVVVAEDVFFADASGICASEQIEIAFSPEAKPEIRWFLSRRS